MDKAANWERTGRWYQFPMIGIFMGQFLLFQEQPHRLMFLEVFDVVGMMMFAWCLIRLYALNARVTGLVTSGLFRYTRHPMYLGFLLMNVGYWLRVSVWTSPLFLLTEALFIGCMLGAGYCQEQETLERFGTAAEDYYKRTPRVPSYSMLREGLKDGARLVQQEWHKARVALKRNQ